MMERMFDYVELAERCRKAAGADVVLAGDGNLCEAVGELAAARSALEAAEAHVLAELEARAVCDREFGHQTGAWAALQTHAPRSACVARVRLGTRLRQLDVIDHAMSAGEIGPEQARVIAEAAANPRVADHIREHQGDLVAAAREAPFEIWKRELAELVELLDQDGGYDPDRDEARTKLRLTELGPDTVCVAGELVGESALVVTCTLRAEADRLWRAHRRDHETCPDLPMPSRAGLLAQALVEVCRQSQGIDVERTRGPVADINLVVHTDDLPASDPPASNLATSDRPAAGRSAGADPAARLFTIDGDRLTTAERYAYLWCDPAVHAVILDSLGVPLDLGRTVRFASPGQRRAAAVRDGGCVFPGCDAPMSWCDLHHVDHFEDGGATNLALLASLCRRHHGVSHRHGWTMTAAADQRFVWTTPSGGTLHSQRHFGRASGGP
jgi:hypothetical protein